MDTWFNAKFDHLKVTGYALTGAHATLPCTACHINNVFKGTPATCYACHTNDFVNSNNPPHVQLGLPHDCGTCHSTTDWLNAKFDHTLYANYPLTGAHATVACAQCHMNNNYTSTPTDCYCLPQGRFHRHDKSESRRCGFPTNCSLCHTTSGWSPSTFNHSTRGLSAHRRAHHRALRAMPHEQQLHNAADRLLFLPQGRLHGTNNPNHVTAGFPTTCATCHNTTSWTSATFNHNNTAFPLTGAHVTVACAQCHVNNNYTTLPTTCYGCHQADFTGTTNPAHVAAGFPPTALYATHVNMDDIDLQSCFGLSADRSACHGCLRTVPYQQQLHNAADHLLRMPPGRFHRNHESESYRGGVPDHLRHLPYDDELDIGHIQSCNLCELSADRRACDSDLRAVPHEQQLHEHADGVLLVPSGGLHRHHEPESCCFRLPDGLLDLPLDERLEPVIVQSQQHGVPAHRRAHDSCSARTATRTTTTRRCPPLATAATRPIGMGPRIRITQPRDSRPHATPATRRRPGRAPRSTTTTRRSR